MLLLGDTDNSPLPRGSKGRFHPGKRPFISLSSWAAFLGPFSKAIVLSKEKNFLNSSSFIGRRDPSYHETEETEAVL